MHTPFCTVAARCSQCDTHRAKREVDRLRGVLRVTMDELIAERAEVKDANAKIGGLRQNIIELEVSIRLAQSGKITVSNIFPPSYKALSDSAPAKVWGGWRHE